MLFLGVLIAILIVYLVARYVIRIKNSETKQLIKIVGELGIAVPDSGGETVRGILHTDWGASS